MFPFFFLGLDLRGLREVVGVADSSLCFQADGVAALMGAGNIARGKQLPLEPPFACLGIFDNHFHHTVTMFHQTLEALVQFLNRHVCFPPVLIVLL